MALANLAGGGGFLSADDVRRYDENLKQYAAMSPQEQQQIANSGQMVKNGMRSAQYPTGVSVNTGISNFLEQGLSGSRINTQSPGVYSVTKQNYIAPSAKDIPTNYGKSVTGSQNMTIPPGEDLRIGGPPGPDMGIWGTGMNMGPLVNGTVQTGGGMFTPEGYYSAGYQGSGEHPEITGESTPGQFKAGSFGAIVKPDLSNPIKVSDFLKYVANMGYDISTVDRQALQDQYHKTGGNFDALTFLKTLPQSDANKTSLLSQIAGNPMMSTQNMYQLLGGTGFANLFGQGVTPQAGNQSALSQANSQVQAATGGTGGGPLQLAQMPSTDALRIGGAPETQINPSALQGALTGYNNLLDQSSLFNK